MLCAQAWKPGSQHAGEKRGVAGLLLGRTERAAGAAELHSIFPRIRVFSNESALLIRWPTYWSFSVSPSNEYSGLISFRMDWLNILVVRGTLRIFSNTTVQKHQFFVPSTPPQDNIRAGLERGLSLADSRAL